jgi:branched-chain amino acid transport system permease protein
LRWALCWPGLAGALQLPREPAQLDMDLNTIGAAFVVVVVGGMGSIPGAFVAALLIAELKAVCVWAGLVEVGGISLSLSKMTLVVEFLVMAVVLVWRPWGLLGQPQPQVHAAGVAEAPLHPASRGVQWLGWAVLAALALVPLLAGAWPYAPVLLVDLLVAVLFASSLHFLMGPAGMHSFGHAAYFGLGAYAAALLVQSAGVRMEVALLLAPLAAGVAALVYGWFCVRLSGVYLTMLTLAFAQITWALCYQWDAVTGGSNGIAGVWPAPWLASQAGLLPADPGPGGGRRAAAAAGAAGAFWLCAARGARLGPAGRCHRHGRAPPAVGGVCGGGRFCRPGRGAVCVFQGQHFARRAVGGQVGGWAGDGAAGRRAEPGGPLGGRGHLTWLHDTVARNTDYWRAVLGGTMLALVLLFPQGLAGFARLLALRWQARRSAP